MGRVLRIGLTFLDLWYQNCRLYTTYYRSIHPLVMLVVTVGDRIPPGHDFIVKELCECHAITTA